MKEKYDLIVSIGAACSCSQTLRAHYLQDFSYPFDWLYGSDLVNRVKILISGFEDWFNKEDLVYDHDEPTINGIAYKNKKTDIVFNHDFKKDRSFDEQYQDIVDKYQRRINRLLDKIKEANKILFVFIERPNYRQITTDDELILAEELLQKAFGNKVNLLYLYNNDLPFDERTDVNLSENIRKILCGYQAPNTTDHSVNRKILHRIFKNYKLKRTFLNQCRLNTKIILVRLLCAFIPKARLRKKIKRKYRI